MMREVGEGMDRSSFGGFKGFCDSQVQLRSAHRGEPVVDRTPDQLVRKAKYQSALGQLLDDPASDRLVERGKKLGLG